MFWNGGLNMKSKFFITVLFLFAISLVYSIDINYYIDTNATGQRFVSFSVHGSFSEFNAVPRYKLRFSYTLTDKIGNIIKKDRDYREFDGNKIKKLNIKYFASKSWANIDVGNYIIKISVVELSSHSRKVVSQTFTVKKSYFLDNIIMAVKGDKNYKSGKTIYYGQNFGILTKIKNNAILKWDFKIKNNNGESVYEIKSSTTADKGIVKLFSGYLNSLDFSRGDYKAIFHAEENGQTFINTRKFSIGSPEYGLAINDYKPLIYKGATVRNAESKKTIYSEGQKIAEVNTHIYNATYSGFVTSAFYNNDSIVGLIYSKAELRDNYSASSINVISKLFFNQGKNIIDWDIYCYSNGNKNVSNSIHVDFANNPLNPIAINRNNPIISLYKEGKIRKQYEIKRGPNSIYPFLQASVPSEGSYTYFQTLLPVLYEYMKEIFNTDYTQKQKRIILKPNTTNIFAMYLNPREIKKGSKNVELNKSATDLDEEFVPLYNLHLYKQNNKLKGFEWTGGIKGYLIEE